MSESPTLHPEPLKVVDGIELIPNPTHREIDFIMRNVKALDTIMKQKEQLRQAEIDPVTGLHNGLWFTREAPRLKQRAMQDPSLETLLIFIDANGLKRRNDTKGHEAGDIFLKSVGEGIASMTRPGDVFARIGGDEFALVINAPKGTADNEEFIKEFRSRANLEIDGLLEDKDPYGKPISVGMSVWEDGQTLEAVKDLSDKQMYADKISYYEQQKTTPA